MYLAVKCDGSPPRPRLTRATSAVLYETACMDVKRTARCCWGCVVQYFAKGAASICGVVAIINEEFSDEALKKEVEDRLMPRTEELPLYTTQEFNDKVETGIRTVKQTTICTFLTALYISLIFDLDLYLEKLLKLPLGQIASIEQLIFRWLLTTISLVSPKRYSFLKCEASAGCRECLGWLQRSLFRVACNLRVFLRQLSNNKTCPHPRQPPSPAPQAPNQRRLHVM